jgi:hypothetical protein
MSCVTSQLDLLVFSQLIDLFGFKKGFKDGFTTHLVIFEQKEIGKSKKIEQ